MSTSPPWHGFLISIPGTRQIDPADVAKPEEIAAAIAYLASEDASFVHGESLRVDGGRLSRL